MTEKPGNTPGTPQSAPEGGGATPQRGPESRDQAEQPPPAASEGQPAKDQSASDDPLRGSRTSGVWIATAAIGILLVLLVIFIVQNTQEVDIAYLGWEGRLPLSAGLMIAVAAGILITTTAGGLRILQLRHRVKRESRKVKKADKQARKSDKKAQKERAGA